MRRTVSPMRRPIRGAGWRCSDIPELLGQRGGHGHFTVQILAAFQQQQGRHKLGQAGNILLLVSILVQDGLAGVGVEQVHRLGLAGGLDGHGIYARPGSAAAAPVPA